MKMSRYISTDLAESIKSYIVNKATILYKNTTSEHPHDISSETWDHIFEQIKYQIKYYSGIFQETNPNPNNPVPMVYPSESYNDYVARIGDLQQLGPYDHMEFYKKMKKEPAFEESIRNSYEKAEKIKKIKQEIITYVLALSGYNNIQDIRPIESINIIPVHEYISTNNICIEEPIYENFRSNTQEFYEMYTLWDMQKL